jgi:lipoyl(octanoyl) transferase
MPPNYGEGQRQQILLAARVLSWRTEPDNSRVGCYLHGEVEHVYTLGVHGKVSNLLVTKQVLERDGISLVRTDRGGDITYHGPGQLLGYPILDLHRLGLGVKGYIEALESAVMLTLSAYAIATTLLADAPGVWLVPKGNIPLRKICAVGVHVNQGITTHGFALNVHTDLGYFTRINPCGFTSRGVTSMAQELGNAPPFAEVDELLTQMLARVLNIKIAPCPAGTHPTV